MADGTRRGAGRKAAGKPPALSFHGSIHEVDAFHPLSHFGTLRAAAERLVTRNGETGLIYAVALDVANPITVTDGDAILHHRPSTYARRFERQGILTRHQADAVALEPCWREGGRILGETLLALGHGVIRYRNRYEDPGSASWVILSPGQVRLAMDPIPVTRSGLETLLERTGPFDLDGLRGLAGPSPMP